MNNLESSIRVGLEVNHCETDLYDMFAKSVSRFPDRISLIYGDSKISYMELNRKVNEIALAIEQKIDPESKVVGICISRSIEQVVAILATLKLNRVCLMLNAQGESKVRVSYMLSTCGCNFVLSDKGVMKRKFSDQVQVYSYDDLENSKNAVTRNNQEYRGDLSSDNAFIFFTSGSTGSPKGVWVSHRSTINSLQWRKELCDIECDDVFFYKAPISSDICLWEIFLGILNGASIFIAKPLLQTNPKYLLDSINQHGISVVQFVGSLLKKVLLDSPDIHDSKLRALMCGGEYWDGNLVSKVFEKFPGIRLFNFYGQTETSLGVLAYECNPEGNYIEVPLLNICFNTVLAIGDKEHLCVGDVGELWVGGEPLSSGYVNNEEANQKSYTMIELRGLKKRFYKTGDYFRVLEGEKLEFVGRKDFQVKLHGVRVQVEEIEQLVNSIEDVSASIARVERANGLNKLTLYIVPISELVDLTDLKKTIRTSLPAAMTPDGIQFIETIPVTANGKVDRDFKI
ncbi:AMP-binding protein [Reinekea sp. G2M2-21]|uniref:AMP-binding protein n=1 Tax=Reinekea sp. G2M2-21 TaxID=2788942 RepID=UPI0018A91A54|nr:AMP-binding protein [Reinekea sp. G2M2-21]